jgi:uncharacterized GH25 family protein
MIRCLAGAAVVLAMAGQAFAHFVFIVPQAGGHTARVILSEDLDADAEVGLIIAGGPKLSVKTADGVESPLALRKIDGENCEVDLPGEGTRVAHGDCDLGVMQRGNSKPFLLLYHPKTIVGDAVAAHTRLGEATPVEIVPQGEAGKLTLLVLAQGKPANGVEVNLVLPDGERTKVTTDDQGLTPAQTQTGRYGAWTRHFESKAGESGGKPYEEIRHYATLVIDVPATK